MRRRVRNNGFTTKVDAFTSSGISGAACGARLRASAAGGCGPHGSKSRTTATANRSPGPTAPRIQAFCHSERSEESFPLRTKGRGRTMPSKEDKDKRRTIKNLSTYTFIQILRRSAPQNDKLLNCSQTPQQTGICNWRQRGKVERKRCSGRPRLVEIQSGFSRASRSPATRRLAELAPLASARKQHSADRSRACELTTYALSE